MTEDEYNAKCDSIRANIQFHLMTEREEIQVRAAFDGAMAALRYVRLDAMGMDKPSAEYYAEPPSDASMSDRSVISSHPHHRTERRAGRSRAACIEMSRMPFLSSSSGLDDVAWLYRSAGQASILRSRLCIWRQTPECPPVSRDLSTPDMSDDSRIVAARFRVCIRSARLGFLCRIQERENLGLLPDSPIPIADAFRLAQDRAILIVRFSHLA